MASQVSDGVTKEILKAGYGDMPRAGDQITVHCTGSLVNPPRKFWRLTFKSCFLDIELVFSVRLVLQCIT